MSRIYDTVYSNGHVMRMVAMCLYVKLILLPFGCTGEKRQRDSIFGAVGEV
jgi:hypothetical protein